MHEETFQVLLPPTQCAWTQCLLFVVVRKALTEGNACVWGSLCGTVYVSLQDITFQKMLWILYHCNLQTFVLESYSLMNVFLAWEQLLQVQLEVSQKCQQGWSFQVPWGECSCLCNPVFLLGQPVSITWQLVESRWALYCRCGCLLSIAWGPGILSVTVLLCGAKVRALLWHSYVKGLLWDQGLFALSTECGLSFLQLLRVSWRWRASELAVPLRNAYSSWNNMYLSAWDVSEWFPGQIRRFHGKIKPQQNLFCLDKLQSCTSGNVQWFQIAPSKDTVMPWQTGAASDPECLGEATVSCREAVSYSWWYAVFELWFPFSPI